MDAYKNDCFEKASIFDAQIAAETAEKSEHILKVTVLFFWPDRWPVDSVASRLPPILEMAVLL